jgi:hypothetical protein
MPFRLKDIDLEAQQGYIVQIDEFRLCIKEKISEDIVPVDNFVNKEYKYIDSFKLVPTGQILRDSVFVVYEDELCEEIICIDRKPE